MMKNIGTLDKGLRIIIALIIAVIAIIFNIWWLLLVSLIPFLTAFVGYCPLYAPFKINTNNKATMNTKTNTQISTKKVVKKKKK